MEKGETWETVLNGPGLCFSNHGDNGTTELRTAKVIRRQDDDRGMCGYAKLAYSTKYPWEAFTGKGCEAQMYMIQEEEGGKLHKPNALLWQGQKDRVLYRRCFFNYTSGMERHWLHCVELADFPVEEGLIRVDQLRTYRGGLKVTLGSYGFPDMGEVSVKYIEKEGAKAVILKGRDSQGREKQMAMTVFAAWENLELTESRETNADAENSIVICARLTREKLYGYEPSVMISQVITRESFREFTEKEIFSIRNISYADPQDCGGYGPVEIEMQNGRKITVDYSEAEGNLYI